VLGKPLDDLLAAVKKGPPSELENITDPFDDEDDDGISFDDAAKEYHLYYKQH
jgi:hypothetical protein